MKIHALLVALPVVVFASTAHAAAVDFTPLVNYGLEIIAAILGVLAIWGVKRLTGWLGIKTDAEMNAHLDQIIHKGIGFGRQKAAAMLEGKTKIEIENALLREAMTYAAASAPGLLRKAGVTEAKLADMIRARLPDVPEVKKAPNA